ncbi:hypothetical protein FACS1894191_0450 [Clostridia bacterium]|nr:hypothetical protein FACS1894191_0450 [Clostridia bacterium]
MNISASRDGTHMECILGFSFKNGLSWDSYAIFTPHIWQFATVFGEKCAHKSRVKILSPHSV